MFELFDPHERPADVVLIVLVAQFVGCFLTYLVICWWLDRKVHSDPHRWWKLKCARQNLWREVKAVFWMHLGW